MLLFAQTTPAARDSRYGRVPQVDKFSGWLLFMTLVALTAFSAAGISAVLHVEMRAGFLSGID